MATPSELLPAMRAAASLSGRDFTRDWLFRMPPYAFSGKMGEYAAFCDEVSSVLSVPAADLSLVGSGRLGFSMHPDHLLRVFNRESDLDLVIVSSLIFDKAWEELHVRETEFKLASDADNRALKKTHKNLLSGYLRPDNLPVGCSLAREWFPKLSGPYESAVAARHSVSAWLFKSWTYAETFYTDGAERVRPSIHKFLSVRGDI